MWEQAPWKGGGRALGGDLVGDAAGSKWPQGQLHVGASGGHVLGAPSHPCAAGALGGLLQHLAALEGGEDVAKQHAVAERVIQERSGLVLQRHPQL